MDGVGLLVLIGIGLIALIAARQGLSGSRGPHPPDASPPPSRSAARPARRGTSGRPRTPDAPGERDAPPRHRTVTPPAPFSGRCHVIDGDTIVVARTHIRLFGIDAPEIEDPYGQKAKWALVRLTKGKTVTITPCAHETYGRMVARCTLPDGTDLSAEMTRLGLALDWAKFSGGCYRALETADARKRLWRVDAKHRGRMPVSS